jgi:hypothetical protein
LLNPKPPDPEAAFAFPASVFRPQSPKNRCKDERLPNLEALLMSSRSTQTLTRTTTAAFDFDVVSDVAPRPSRKPDAVTETARPKLGAAQEKAKTPGT